MDTQAIDCLKTLPAGPCAACRGRGTWDFGDAASIRLPTAPRAYLPAVGLALAMLLLTVPVAHAQFAVIDVGAIAQLIDEVEILEDQLTTARTHLAQAQLAYASMTGGRGMEQLLRGAPRNYLPTNWGDLQAVMGGGGRFGALGGGVSATVAINAVLTDQSLALLPPDERKLINDRRQLTALQQNLNRQALQTTSDRFDSLQTLIDVLPDAEDQKAVLDLQQRVAAENSMLLNEHNKLMTLSLVVEAQERANQQQSNERAVAGHGEFATRFQPVP
jgi:type IV secretion system protein VirB5